MRTALPGPDAHVPVSLFRIALMHTGLATRLALASLFTAVIWATIAIALHVSLVSGEPHLLAISKDVAL